MAKIVIIGGGVIGSGLAWHLAKAGVADDTVVIEPDPTYEFAATPRAFGGIRFVQGLRENFEMSRLQDFYESCNFAKMARRCV